MSAANFNLHVHCDCGVTQRVRMTVDDDIVKTNPTLATEIRSCPNCGVEVEYVLEIRAHVLNRGLFAYATLTGATE